MELQKLRLEVGAVDKKVGAVYKKVGAVYKKVCAVYKKVGALDKKVDLICSQLGIAQEILHELSSNSLEEEKDLRGK